VAGLNVTKEIELMRKPFAGLALVLFLIFFTFSFLRAQQLAADKLVFDFGTIREGMNVSVYFTISNIGPKKAQIKEIRTFAACVESRPLGQRSLAPGEKITLDFLFESLGYGGATVNKNIEIHYDNPSLSPLKLSVRGKVLALEPYQAPIGEMTYNFFVLVDLRPQESFAKEHIIGAINVPSKVIDHWVSEVSRSFSAELIIYLYCEDGTESDRAAKALREKGYSQFISLVGGLKEWKQQLGTKFLVSGKI
jgi:rhodanese-related sulfurtransferase